MWVFSIITILVILNHNIMLSKINWECRHMGFWTVAKSSGYGIILLATNTKNHESPVKTSKQTPEYCQPCKFYPHHKWDNCSQEISRMRLKKPNHVTCYTNFCTNSGLILPHIFSSVHTCVWLDACELLCLCTLHTNIAGKTVNVVSITLLQCYNVFSAFILRWLHVP